MAIYFLVDETGEVIHKDSNKENVKAIGDLITEYTTIMTAEEHKSVYGNVE